VADWWAKLAAAGGVARRAGRLGSGEVRSEWAWQWTGGGSLAAGEGQRRTDEQSVSAHPEAKLFSQQRLITSFAHCYAWPMGRRSAAAAIS